MCASNSWKKSHVHEVLIPELNTDDSESLHGRSGWLVPTHLPHPVWCHPHINSNLAAQGLQLLLKISDVFKGVTGALHESSKEIRWYNVPMAQLKAASPWYVYSEELKQLWNLGSVVYTKSKHKYRMLCSTAATQHNPVLYFKQSNVTVIYFNWSILWFEMYLASILLSLSWVFVTAYISKGWGKGGPCHY